MLLAQLRGKIEFARNVDLQQFIPGRVTQHADHSIVDFDEASRRGAEKQPLLNVVEQLAVTPFRLAPVGDVFQDMNRLRPFIGRSVNPRGGNQIGAVKHRMHELVGILRHGAAEGTGIGRNIAGKSQQGSHVDTDQLLGRHPDHGGQRAVDAEHLIGFVMYHDKICDGVKNFQPVAVGLLDAGEQTRIFERHRGMNRHGFQKNAIFLRQGMSASRQAQHSSQLSVGAGQAHQGAIVPSQDGSDFGAEQLRRRASHNGLSVPSHQLLKSCA